MECIASSSRTEILHMEVLQLSLKEKWQSCERVQQVGYSVSERNVSAFPWDF